MADAERSVSFGECFLGEHVVAVDKQRRVALPKCWRSDNREENHFFLLPGRERSLQLVPSDIFGELLRKLRTVSFADQQAAVALATVGSMAEKIRCDKQGRFSLTSKLMEHAGLADRALFLGAVTTIQVWEPSAWEARKMDSETGLNVLQALQERPDDFTQVLKQVTKS